MADLIKHDTKAESGHWMMIPQDHKIELEIKHHNIRSMNLCPPYVYMYMATGDQHNMADGCYLCVILNLVNAA